MAAVVESGTPPEEHVQDKGIGRPSDGRFCWASKSGAVIVLPSISKLDPDLGAVLEYKEAKASGDGLALAGAMVNCVLSDPSVSAESAAALRKLRLSEFKDLMAAWSQHSGVDLGESLAS